MNIKIITTESFPVGMAASNRIFSYAKGFAENNCNISIHCLRPTESDKEIFNKGTSGIIDGIHYEYSCGKTVISKHFFNRRIDNFNGIMRLGISLLKENKKNKTDAIIYYSDSTSRAFLLFIITRFKKILLLKEESEFPVVYARHMFPVQKFLFQNFHYFFFDGFLLMTKRLIKYFVEEKKFKTPILHVPMTVDFKRFNCIEKNKNGKYIAYCGVLNNRKDGIDLLIDAFSVLAEDFPEITLYLVGRAASNEENQQYLQKVKEQKLSKKVVFTGRVKKDDIPELLGNATILVLPRPQSIQAEGGFPTKLGEYLATGNPVVATSVGEITDYLTDGVSVFIAEPGSVESLVSKMKTILIDYNFALKVGANGQKVVSEHFNYQIQAKNVINFIKSLRKCVA